MDGGSKYNVMTPSPILSDSAFSCLFTSSTPTIWFRLPSSESLISHPRPQTPTLLKTYHVQHTSRPHPAESESDDESEPRSKVSSRRRQEPRAKATPTPTFQAPSICFITFTPTPSFLSSHIRAQIAIRNVSGSASQIPSSRPLRNKLSTWPRPQRQKKAIIRTYIHIPLSRRLQANKFAN